MLKQFNLEQWVFADPKIATDEMGNTILATSGKGWFAVETQEEIDGISASITGGGEVWEENGKLCYSGKQPSDNHKWDSSKKKWVKLTKAETQEKLTALLAEQRAAVWEKIKQKRHENLRGGAYVKSIGKWFHSNDESRQQYTFLRTLDELPPNLMWKTMDNSFVEVTKAILDELSLQLVLDEQADFTNAERHKAQMEQAESPLDYDFSDGWTGTFEEVIHE